MTTYPFQNAVVLTGEISNIAMIEAREMALAIRLIISAARGRPMSMRGTIAAAGARTVARLSDPIAFISPPIA